MKGMSTAECVWVGETEGDGPQKSEKFGESGRTVTEKERTR